MSTKRLIRNMLLAIVVISILAIATRILETQQTFAPSDFERITIGMTVAEVDKILGRPNEIISLNPGKEQWRYDDGKGLGTVAQYYLTFEDRQVVQKEIDWW